MNQTQPHNTPTPEDVMRVVIEGVRAMFTGHNPDRKVKELRKHLGNAAKQLNVVPSEIRKLFDKILTEKEKGDGKMNFDNTNTELLNFQEDSFVADTYRIEKQQEGSDNLLPRDGEGVVEYVNRIRSNRNFFALHEQCPDGCRGMQVVLEKFPHGNFRIEVGLSQPNIAYASDGCRNPGYKGEYLSVKVSISGGWYETFTEIERRCAEVHRKIEERTAIALEVVAEREKERPGPFDPFLQPLSKFTKEHQNYCLGLLMEAEKQGKQIFYINLAGGHVSFADADELPRLKQNAVWQKAVIGEIAQFKI